METLFLFDIDMTLIRTNGAGLRAMDKTFHELYGVSEAFSGIPFAGRTDGAILRDCYTRHALHEADLAVEFGRFRALYFGHLQDHLTSEQRCEVLPGVAALLETLAARPDVRLGLGTGNYRAAAEIKLRHAGLWHYFRDGGFADDAEDRGDLIAAALRRLRTPETARVWVIGDSEHDISAARANAVPVIGVATGNCSLDTLAQAGADIVFSDLADGAAFLARTLGWSAR